MYTQRRQPITSIARADLVVSSISGRECFQVRLRFAGTIIWALVDTGSELDCFRSEEFDRLGLHLLPTQVAATGAGSQPLVARGEARDIACEVCAEDGQWFTLPKMPQLVVFDQLSHSAIISRATLARWHVVVDCGFSEVCLRVPSAPGARLTPSSRQVRLFTKTRSAIADRGARTGTAARRHIRALNATIPEEKGDLPSLLSESDDDSDDDQEDEGAAVPSLSPVTPVLYVSESSLAPQSPHVNVHGYVLHESVHTDDCRVDVLTKPAPVNVVHTPAASAGCGDDPAPAWE